MEKLVDFLTQDADASGQGRDQARLLAVNRAVQIVHIPQLAAAAAVVAAVAAVAAA